VILDLRLIMAYSRAPLLIVICWDRRAKSDAVSGASGHQETYSALINTF